MTDFYETIFNNKRQIELQQGRGFSLFIYNLKSFFMILKILFNSHKASEHITTINLFLNWSKYEYLYSLLPIKGEIITFNYKDKSYHQISNYLKFSDKLKSIFSCFKSKNFPVKIYYDLEFKMLEKLILSRGCKNVYINSIYDRYSYYIEKICFDNNLNFNIIQHGALTDFKLNKYHTCNEFWLLFNHSEKLINKNNKVNNFKFLNKKSKIQSNDNYKNLPSFGTTPNKNEENYLIINLLLQLNDKIIIYPHPRDNCDYSKLKNVLIINNARYFTDKYFVCGISTLGVEFIEAGCKTFFYNPENKVTDFTEFYSEYICNDTNELINLCSNY